MDNIILLGDKVEEFSRFFSQYSQYSVFTISTREKEDENHFQLPVMKAEKYENIQLAKKAKKKLKTLGKDVLVICTAEDVSFFSLVFLEQIKKGRSISILYIFPDYYGSKTTTKTYDKILSNVFQEYARSGVFERCILLEKQKVLESLEDVPVVQYRDAFFSSVVGCVNFFNRSLFVEPVLREDVEIPTGCRIMTCGFCDYKTWEERVFFPLKEAEIRVYDVWVGDEEIKNLSLVRDIKNRVFNRKAQQKQEVCYRIFHSKNESGNYIFYTDFSSVIQ